MGVCHFYHFSLKKTDLLPTHIRATVSANTSMQWHPSALCHYFALVHRQKEQGKVCRDEATIVTDFPVFCCCLVSAIRPGTRTHCLFSSNLPCSRGKQTYTLRSKAGKAYQQLRRYLPLELYPRQANTLGWEIWERPRAVKSSAAEAWVTR